MGDQSVNVGGSGNRVVAHSTNSGNTASGSNSPSQDIDIVLAGVEREEGSVTVSYDAITKEWMVGVVFGREAEDSPMARGASYGVGPSLAECLRHIVEETGWDRR